MLQESGIEKALANDENMAYFDYSKSALGFEGDFGDLAGTFPVSVVTNEHLGLIGATLIARSSMTTAQPASGA